MQTKSLEAMLDASIRTIPDYRSPASCSATSRRCSAMRGRSPRRRRTRASLGRTRIDKVAGMEARASFWAARSRINCPPVSCRSAKKGKLPHAKVSIAYSLEYGIDRWRYTRMP